MSITFSSEPSGKLVLVPEPKNRLYRHSLPHQRNSTVSHRVLKIRLTISLEPGSEHSKEQQEENADQKDKKPSFKLEAWKAEKSEAKGGEGCREEEIRARTYPYHLDINNFCFFSSSFISATFSITDQQNKMSDSECKGKITWNLNPLSLKSEMWQPNWFHKLRIFPASWIITDISKWTF